MNRLILERSARFEEELFVDDVNFAMLIFVVERHCDYGAICYPLGKIFVLGIVVLKG